MRLLPALTQAPLHQEKVESPTALSFPSADHFDATARARSTRRRLGPPRFRPLRCTGPPLARRSLVGVNLAVLIF